MKSKGKYSIWKKQKVLAIKFTCRLDLGYVRKFIDLNLQITLIF